MHVRSLILSFLTFSLQITRNIDANADAFSLSDAIKVKATESLKVEVHLILVRPAQARRTTGSSTIDRSVFSSPWPMTSRTSWCPSLDSRS